MDKGIFRAVKKDGTVYYRASLTYCGKHISLGSYRDAGQAHSAYEEGIRLLNDSSLSLKSYRETSSLSFEKWVCLLNFRDNGIYLGSPIYMGQQLFYYYLTPHHVLKFDLEDLFYYSSHKIMRRGNHYFVSDYGMQLTLTSRYGIKSYAVPGRDYCFRNGDPTDFRRENLQIHNIYHGVRKTVTKNGQHLYTVRIHIHGNYLVGRYATDVEAAIAYNKAIDILRNKGVTNNFLSNYVEGIAPSRYAEIYSSLPIAPGILNYPAISPNNQ
ncbi:MAG: hypothetical protein J6B69_04630 [Lachnospiraceae bacterium]|nr:hypothetical protein [Lachnospiraceae bacterium]